MFAALATVALSASAAYSQTLPTTGSSPEGIAQQGLSSISSECRRELLSLATSPLSQCLSVSTLLPAISANASIAPILDSWMTEICASEPCDQDLLESAATNLTSACGSDLETYGVNGTELTDVFGLYPLARELVCLKTTEPFESNSTSNANSTSTSNSTMASNETSSDNATFCVTSVLEEVNSYIGMNLTVNSIFEIAFGSDKEGLKALSEIPPSALCQDCVYSAAGLIEQTYPGIWDRPLVNGHFNVSGFLNETCSNETFAVIDEETNTITLPASVYPSVENSTYPYAIEYTNGTSNGTYTPSENVQQPPSLPFANIAAAPINNGTSNSTESTTTSSTSAPVSSTSASASSASSVAASAITSASAAAAKRDVTAAKRRWAGQQ